MATTSSARAKALTSVTGTRRKVDVTVTRRPAEVLGPRANRTIALILDASREIFLKRGYAGTTIDEIAKAAGVSRASFYTYFPSKRDVLLAVGTRSASDASAAFTRLGQIEPSLAALTDWVREFFVLLDTHGAFAFAWTQAAGEDSRIREAGMRTHLDLCRRLGMSLQALGEVAIPDPTVLGLAATSTLERGWDYSRLYAGSIDRPAMEGQIARILWGSIRSVPVTTRRSGQPAVNRR